MSDRNLHANVHCCLHLVGLQLASLVPVREWSPQPEVKRTENGDLGKFNPANCPNGQLTANPTLRAIRRIASG